MKTVSTPDRRRDIIPLSRKREPGRAVSGEHAFDVVVVGAGGSGLAAALAAREKGASVVVLEKRGMVGGNSARASGLFAAESPLQKRLGVDGGTEEFIKAALDYSHWKIDPRIIAAFVKKSGDTVRWLEEKGVIFVDLHDGFTGLTPRVFHVPEAHGAGLVRRLVKSCRHSDVAILPGVAARKLLTDREGRVFGVIAAGREEELRLRAGSVIIAAGGYGGNKQLLSNHCPHYVEDFDCVGLPLKGDGLLMAMEVGAATEGLGILLAHGPHFKGALDIAHVAIQPNVVWVNGEGERFFDESRAVRWPEAANALNRQPGMTCFTVIDHAQKETFMREGGVRGTRRMPAGHAMTDLDVDLKLHATKGSVRISDSWASIAAWIGTESTTLANSIAKYNGFCDRGLDDDFFKAPPFLQPLRTPPFYAIRCPQSFLDTVGGIKINHRMEVIDRKGATIPGLYAAGSGTGGWESDTHCLALPGSIFGFAVNSGRIAGENAAVFALRRSVGRIGAPRGGKEVTSNEQ